MQSKLYKFLKYLIILGLSINVTTLWAAKAVNLRQQPLSTMQALVMVPGMYNYKIIHSTVDQNNTSHVRIQQTYQDYPVFGADAVMHVPDSERITTPAGLHAMLANPKSAVTYNGIVYQDLASDLGSAPKYIFESAQADKALAETTQRFQQQTTTLNPITESNVSLIVYVDDNSTAHWAYKVSFKSAPKKGVKGRPAKPVLIVDAFTFNVYQQWDEVKTLSDVDGGGFGGNSKTGKLSYDSLDKDLPKLTMERNSLTRTCYLENDEVVVKDMRYNEAVSTFKCKEIDKDHKVFWDDEMDEVNGAYSPGNDALYAGKVVKALYQDWFNIPVLTDMDGAPMWLVMRVHDYMDNAYWDGEAMTFGDGSDEFYPLVSPGIAAHEISHGFTHQHSGLIGGGQAGGLNEAFSDMAAQAVEFYATQHNTWKIGAEVIRAPNSALRYLDEPTKDCEAGHLPGVDCSISNLKDYYVRLDVHYSSGVFNKLFYLLATSPDWDTKKAFTTMVHANMNYWTYNTTFIEAACGVESAAKDLGYPVETVTKAAVKVGISTKSCGKPVTTPPGQKPLS
jgi:pseudolysin